MRGLCQAVLGKNLKNFFCVDFVNLLDFAADVCYNFAAMLGSDLGFCQNRAFAI